MNEVQFFEERNVHRVTSILKFIGTDRISLAGSENKLLWQDRGLYTCTARSEVGDSEGDEAVAESTMSLNVNGDGRD